MPYDERYESSLMRGLEEPRTWDITAEIRKRVKPGDRVLDVGCGTAFKVLPVASVVKEIVGLDPNPRMREKALENIANAGAHNVSLVDGVSDKLPFADATFDVVTCLVAHQTPEEFHRVLKPGGWVVTEQFGEQDKRTVAECFGERGIFAKYGKEELVAEHRRRYEQLFPEVRIRVGRWSSYLTYEGLVLLLEQVPLVSDFNRGRDEASLQKVRATLMTDKGILVPHERVLIEARKS